MEGSKGRRREGKVWDRAGAVREGRRGRNGSDTFLKVKLIIYYTIFDVEND